MHLSVSKKRLLCTVLLVVCSLALVVSNLELFFQGTRFNEPMLSWVLLLLIGGCYLQSVRIQLHPLLNFIWMVGGFLLLPYYLVPIIEQLAGQDAAAMGDNIFWLNYLCCQAVYVLVFAITNHYKLTMVVSTVFCFLVGVVNHFVLLFRSSPLQLTDVMSVSTAADVAGNYVISLDRELLLLVTWLFFAICVACVAEYRPKKYGVPSVVCSLVLLAILCHGAGIFYSDALWKENDLRINFWNPLQGYQQNGTVLSLAMAGKYLRPEKPEQYSPNYVEQVVQEAQGQPGSIGVPGQKKDGELPNIIAIMNESYADLSVLGEFQTSVPYLEYYNSLKKNTIRGNLSVSVLGGGTCNSEFEFLTGLTTAFLPSGVMAYQQYIGTPLDSMATILKDQGYQTVAFHPGKPDSWRRDQVYPLLGFDTFLTEKDMEHPTYMREAYVTDSSNYKEIMNIFEEKGDEKLFLFNVTIQNHGGYQLATYDIPKWVSLKGMNRYPETEQYLSIMRASDVALKELITYFEKVEEPTLLVFFGDHQPSIEAAFVESLMGKPLNQLNMDEVQQRYKVPFFIWANYDIEEAYYDSISVNYLSTLAMETAGVQLPAYNQYLQRLYPKLPMINAIGYADASGAYHYFTDETPEADLIAEYRAVQYNYLFGGMGRLGQLYQVEQQGK